MNLHLLNSCFHHVHVHTVYMHAKECCFCQWITTIKYDILPFHPIQATLTRYEQLNSEMKNERSGKVVYHWKRGYSYWINTFMMIILHFRSLIIQTKSFPTQSHVDHVRFYLFVPLFSYFPTLLFSSHFKWNNSRLRTKM